MNNLEIERKFLLNLEKIPYDFSKLNKKVIEQGYIICKPEIRVRNVSNEEYVMTIKGNTEDTLVRNEVEFKISKEAYTTLMSRNDIYKLSKNRYIINEGEHVFEIDIFEGKLKGLACLEVEFNSLEEANSFRIPSWVKREVTNDFRYTNSELSKNVNRIEELL